MNLILLQQDKSDIQILEQQIFVEMYSIIYYSLRKENAKEIDNLILIQVYVYVIMQKIGMKLIQQQFNVN